MDTANDAQRKNFRCVFNKYISEFNKDAVILSIISQFEGYFAEPEVTLTDDGFILSITLGDNLSSTLVRDKILWNNFIERVTTQDAIRKIQIIRLPKANKENEGTVGAWGPRGSNSGVDEIMVVDDHPIPHEEYKIDMGDRPDGPMTFNSSIHYADPTNELLPQIYGPGAETDEPVDEDLRSDITNMNSKKGTALDGGEPVKNHSKLFMGFKILAIDSDTGGAFTLNQPNGFQDVDEPPRDGGLQQRATPATGIGGGAPISGASWYVTQPGNEQGTDLGTERNKIYDIKSTSAPFGAIAASKEDLEEDVESAVDLPQARGGGQSVPDGGQVEGWFASSYFGLNETYGYEGDENDYNI
jgi:hypothetical protein